VGADPLDDGEQHGGGEGRRAAQQPEETYIALPVLCYLVSWLFDNVSCVYHVYKLINLKKNLKKFIHVLFMLLYLCIKF
jgi:hypothetical protein